MELFLLLCVAAFALQWLLLTLTKRRFRPLRCILPALAALLALLAPVCLVLTGEFMGPQIAALICTTAAAALAAACALAWGIFALCNRRKH